MRRAEKSVDFRGKKTKKPRHDTLFLLWFSMQVFVVLFTSPNCDGAQLFRQKFWKLSVRSMIFRITKASLSSYNQEQKKHN